MANDFNASLQALLATAERWRSDTETTSNPEEEDQTPTVQVGEVVEFLLQATLLSMKSSMRFWRRGTGIFATRLLEILRTIPTLTTDPTRHGEARGIVIDTLRTYVREIAELPGHESRRFLAELGKIEARLGATHQGRPEDLPRRRCHIKV
ncbi:MAG: hypothetical protein EXR78_07670 [Deltaproteobacteria bacterium]|nr:hypothetical protein [Deltaproteobacteria bacterium]